MVKRCCTTVARQARCIGLRRTTYVTVYKARFPRPELTGDWFPLPVNKGRVDGLAFPLAELTELG